AEARAALAEAVAAGLLQEVAVAGWAKPAYLLPGTPVPRKVAHPPMLLSPFDSLIWSRERTRRLFGFHYRLEVYVPAGKRVHGYYTMPVLAGGRLVARVDPKHDRQAGRLLLRNLHLEPGAAPAGAGAACPPPGPPTTTARPAACCCATCTWSRAPTRPGRSPRPRPRPAGWPPTWAPTGSRAAPPCPRARPARWPPPRGPAGVGAGPAMPPTLASALRATLPT